ncbi:MAG TPA: SH3 domain-containing protein [Chloroflexota bacterium]|nr:SH3 domain-containing protein [Chloroflexota bacterium]
MRTTTRRRNRLRSAQYGTERWKPPTALVILTVGLVFGLALGMSNRLSNQSANVQQHYLLLVSDLYAQGVPLASVRDRLVALGYSNPSVAVLAVADQLAHSKDGVSQQESDQLHQFAEALVAGPGSDASSPSQSQSQSQGQPQSESEASPTAVPPPVTPSAATSLPAAAPINTVTPAPAEQPTATTSAASSPGNAVPPPPTPTAVPTRPPAPKATAAPAKAGVIHTSGRQPAIMRSLPTTKSTAVAVVPDGAKITVYGAAQGQAIDPGDARWYHVVYDGKQGYLYDKLIQIGG